MNGVSVSVCVCIMYEWCVSNNFFIVRPPQSLSNRQEQLFADLPDSLLGTLAGGFPQKVQNILVEWAIVWWTDINVSELGIKEL